MAGATNKQNKPENAENDNKEIQTTPSIDIEAIIAKAVADAVSKTANQYEPVIFDLKSQVETLHNENKSLKESKTETSSKRVKIMYMGAGRATFSKGKVNLEFKKLFDTREVRYEIFEDMFDMFSEYFTSFELVVLNKEIRDQVGLEYSFKEHGADKSIFTDMLKSSVSECTKRIDNLSYSLAMVFLKYFIDEYIAGNADALMKYNQVVDFYRTKFNMIDLHDQINEMRSA